MKTLAKIFMILLGIGIIVLCVVFSPFVLWSIVGDDPGGGTFGLLIIAIIAFIIGVSLLVFAGKIKSDKKEK